MATTEYRRDKMRAVFIENSFAVERERGEERSPKV
jgi:hypothetical protein